MQFLLLTRKATNVSSRRLLASFEQRGQTIEAIDPLACCLVAETGSVRVLRDGRELRPDAVIPRFGPGLTEFGLSLLRHFETRSVPTLNTSRAIMSGRDKFRSMQLMAAAGVDIPKTVLARSGDAPGALDSIPGESLVAKVLQGSQGTGVVLLESRDFARRFLDTASREKQNILVQERVTGAGRDLRMFVVGGRVVAAMARQRSQGFRSNLHVGGRGIALATEDMDAALPDVAVKAARAVGLEVAGVDIMESDRGPLVLEANPSPGIEGIEAVTGVDVAGAVADYFIERVREVHGPGRGEP